MSDINIKEKVISIIAETLDIEVEKIKPESLLVEDLECDSLDIVELVMAFEEVFAGYLKGESIPEEEAENLKNVQSIIDYIENKRDNVS